MADHLTAIQEGKEAALQSKITEAKDIFNTYTGSKGPLEEKTLLRAANTGHWLTVMPTITSGCLLSSQEWRDAFCLRYARVPPDFPIKCDGCGGKFSVDHALDCKKGGLVISRHNEMSAEIIHAGV